MVQLVRVAALTGYFEAMAELGADPLPLLREQKLSARLLGNSEQPIPALAAMRLMERSAAVTGCMTLGLRMAQIRGLDALGPASLLVAHEPTLAAALNALQEFRQRINSTLVLQWDPEGADTMLREHFALEAPEPFRQSSNLAVGVLAGLCSAVVGPRWAPKMVCFTHAAPSRQELAAFDNLFGCPTLFNAEFNGLVVPTTQLEMPSALADVNLARHARRLLEAAMQPGPQTVVHEVDQLIRLLLPSGQASIQFCADSMGLPVRTLQRHLDEADVTFSELLKRARKQLATEYLANPHLRITDVADLLGYSSIGAFSRWHTQAFGMSPARARNSLGAVAP